MVLVPSRGYLKCVTLTFSVTLPCVYTWHTVAHTRTRMQTGAMQLDAIHHGAVLYIYIYTTYITWGSGLKMRSAALYRDIHI